MMLPNVDSENNSGDGSSSGRLLRDIEEISEALYLHKTPPITLVSPSDRRSKSVGKVRFSGTKSEVAGEDFLNKDKKPSIWNWKPLKALSHVKNRRFNCCFFLHVHTIEGLPLNFNDLCLCVNWSRKEEVLQTRPVRGCQGMARFEETLMSRCTIYGSRSGPHNSAKYGSKLCKLHASVIEAPALDIGKHWIDLTRLLPLNLEELEEDKSSGKWSTNFKLAGKAKGAVLNVSFGYSIDSSSSYMTSDNANFHSSFVDDKHIKTNHLTNVSQTSSKNLLWKLEGVTNANCISYTPSQSLDIKTLDNKIPIQGLELARSISFLYKKLDEGNAGNSKDIENLREDVEAIRPMAVPGVNFENDSEFKVIEQGVEWSSEEQIKLEETSNLGSSAIETIDVAEIFRDDWSTFDGEIELDSEIFVGSDKTKDGFNDSGYNDNETCDQEQDAKKCESFLCSTSVSGPTPSNSSPDISKICTQENYLNTTSSRLGKMGRSLSLDEVTESVANEFFDLLGIGSPQNISSCSDPESPRECLLRQFEKEAQASDSFLLDFNVPGSQIELFGSGLTDYYSGDCSDDFSLPFVVEMAREENAMVNKSLINRRQAKMLESLETEALMRQWGLDEKAFQNSPRISSDGFGSPVYSLPQEPSKLPPLGEGIGPIIQIRSGGFLRSMNPSLFRHARNGFNLIMQASGPVVLPAALGSCAMEMLRSWTSVGFERMYIHINDLMPLEDITGKTIQQVVRETTTESLVLERLPWVHEPNGGRCSFFMKSKAKKLPSLQSSYDFNSSLQSDEIDSDYVPLEDLTPLALTNIEALLIEGLRIQSSMTDEEAPSSIKPQLVGKCVKIDDSLTSEDAAGLQVLNLESGSFSVDDLMSLSLSLDDWVRLDSWAFSNEDAVDERLLKILKAHQSKFMILSDGRFGNNQLVNPSRESPGIFGNSFTVALRLQLRDPFRNYETVGAPMLTFIQVERIIVSTEQQIQCSIEDIGGEVMRANFETEKKTNVQFKISEVHVAGLNAKCDDKQLFGNMKPRQSGSRWLLSSGMGKTNKNPVVKSNAMVKSSSQTMRKVKHVDTLWSISSHVHGTSSKWKELAAFSIHVRNPDIVFP